VGIIGGSGLNDPDILRNKTVKSVDTPYGKVFIVVMVHVMSIKYVQEHQDFDVHL